MIFSYTIDQTLVLNPGSIFHGLCSFSLQCYWLVEIDDSLKFWHGEFIDQVSLQTSLTINDYVLGFLLLMVLYECFVPRSC